jgi:CubicO group peptidase (beta-lactamase class C family)
MGKAKSLGFSGERLTRIDRFLQDKYVGPGRMPCAQFVLARKGEVVHESVIGMRDVERATPLTSDTVFRIYSMTKPVTSVALMMLVEEGLIALDDPVSKHIPSWSDMRVYSAGLEPAFLTTAPARPMQVVDLLRHTSGLTYGFQSRTNVDAAYRKLKVEEPYAGHDLEAFVEMLAKLPLEFSPGEAWNYSVATDVCGYLVQKVAGKPLDQVFRERIFEPLKMHDTGFHVREDQRSRFGACYNATPKGGLKLQDDPETSPYLNPRRCLPAAAASSPPRPTTCGSPTCW